MTGTPDWPYGPYTIDDLDALPDEGVRRELVNGWILVAPWPSTFHDHAAKVLERALDVAATEPANDDRWLGLQVDQPVLGDARLTGDTT